MLVDVRCAWCGKVMKDRLSFQEFKTEALYFCRNCGEHTGSLQEFLERLLLHEHLRLCEKSPFVITKSVAPTVITTAKFGM